MGLQEDTGLGESQHISQDPAFKKELLFLEPNHGYEIVLNGNPYMQLFTKEGRVFGRFANGRMKPLSLTEHYEKDGLILATNFGDWHAFAPEGVDVTILDRIFTKEELSVTETDSQKNNELLALAVALPSLIVSGYFCSDLAQTALREVATNWIAFESYLRSGWFMQP